MNGDGGRRSPRRDHHGRARNILPHRLFAILPLAGQRARRWSGPRAAPGERIVALARRFTANSTALSTASGQIKALDQPAFPWVFLARSFIGSGGAGRDAAHVIHSIAGQAYDMGRGCRSMAEVIVDAAPLGIDLARRRLDAISTLAAVRVPWRSGSPTIR